MYSIEDIGMIKDKVVKICALTLATVLISGAMLFAGGSSAPLAIEAGAIELPYSMSASYKSSKYYKNLQSLNLSGDDARDVLAIAMSQVGYHEGDSAAELDGLGNTGTRDFVEYNLLYGKLDNNQGNGMSYGYYWCASFVNWCLRLAGVDKGASGSEVSCQRWYTDSKKMGIFKSKGGYIPSSGDIIFFKDKGSSDDSTHVGLVRYSDGKYVYTVEGNTSNGSEYSSRGEYVALKKYELTSSYISGYATPKYESNKTARRVDYSGGFLSLGDYISTDEIKVYSDKELSSAGRKVISAHAVFKVKEITQSYVKVSFDGAEGYIGVDMPALQLTTSENIYTVNYVNENGTAIFLPQYRRAGEQRYIYQNAPTRDKSGFVGWRMKESPDSMFDPGAKLPNSNSDMTFIAVFDTNYYVVSFKTEDGIVIDQAHGYYGTEYTIPTPPEAPDGYVFAGWGEDVDGVIRGDASYTAIYMTEEEFLAAGASSETETTAAVKPPLDEDAAELISILATVAVFLIVPAAFLPLMLGGKKKRRK